jgi:hypothetical protein
MAVPNIFANVTTSIPLSQLDQNFATAITLGNTAVYLGNTTTTLGNVTFTNANVASGNVTVTTLTAPTHNSASSLTFQTNGTTTAMTIDTSQNVGIGTSSPSSFGKLAVTASSGVIGNFESTQSATNANLLNLNATQTNSSSGIRFQVNSGTTAQARIQVNGDSAIVFQQLSSDTERARIDSSGNLCVGRSSVGVGDRFVVQAIASGTIMLGYNSSSTNTYQVLDSGNVRNTNNSYGAISDQRRKENIVDATPKLEKLNQVRIVNFNMIGDEQKQIGVIAQELEQIFPSMVEEDSDGMKAVKYSVFVPMLIKAIQEQQTIIEQLKADVAALKGKL